jgi:hypothetical protein
MESTPTEVLTGILEHLICPPSSDLRTRAAAYRDPQGPWGQSRAALWAACLTGRRLCLLATPFLYRRVLITDGAPLALLFHTLLFHTLLVAAPRLRHHVRTFALLGHMDRGGFEADCWDACARRRHWDDIDGLPPTERSVFGLGMCDELAACHADPSAEFCVRERYAESAALSQSVLGGVLACAPLGRRGPTAAGAGSRTVPHQRGP